MKSIFQIKITLIISVFLLGLIIFKSLQNETIFNSTLGQIAITYFNKNDSTKAESFTSNIDIVKTKRPYTTLAEENFIHWDVKFFNYMRQHSYGDDDTWPGIGTYAFSPLFPLIWRITQLPASFMTIVNYLMFAFSILLLSSLLLNPANFSKLDQLCLFLLALTLPSVFSFYIPYCEATFLLTMSIALWGLMKDKFWVFFAGLTAFALSRPSFMIVGLALIATDIYFLIFHQDYKRFFKDLGTKILPIFIGMMLTFLLQYIESGNFFKMFEVHSLFWNHNFQIPTTITDWSTESYGMNIFSIVCIVAPCALLLFSYFKENQQVKMTEPVSLFSAETRLQYLFTLCMVYFIGNFFFVFLTQGGNLNGLHRYIMVSPFFYIFLFILASKIKSINMEVTLGFLALMIIVGYLALVHGPYQHFITFLDMGYFFSVISLVYFILFNKMNKVVKISFLSVIVLCNTLWLTYLFNHFLNNSYIIA